MSSRDPSESVHDRAWRDAWRERLKPGDDDCPADELLASLAIGELAGEERVALADHVASCRRCAVSYRTLIDLHRAADKSPSSSETVDADETARPRRLPAGLALVAAVLVAVTGLIVIRMISGPTWERDPAAATLRGSLELSVLPTPPSGALLAEAPRRLSWRPLEDDGSEPSDATTSWSVEVYDEEMRPLWQSGRLGRLETRLPDPLRRRLGPGSTIYWRVIREDAEDRRSALFRFRIGQ